MENSEKYLIVVNKEKLFDEKMLSNFELEQVTDSDGLTYIEKRTNNAYNAIKQLMAEKYGIDLSLTSAGRSLAVQQKVYDEIANSEGPEEAARRVAKPGTSEHHLGLALDVCPELLASLPNIDFVNQIKDLPRIEQKDKMYAALHSELEDFGFILRFPREKQDITGFRSERWHIRYVGKEHAKLIGKQGMCLEEYVSALENEKNTSEMGE